MLRRLWVRALLEALRRLWVRALLEALCLALPRTAIALVPNAFDDDEPTQTRRRVREDFN